ncbi:unnamed protein product [Soboliphyme baturini]|uniref:Epidermal growth factor receptor substrate 15-like 1 n=1 Tax=Soboliphyme baturini TaxID=241478 RepID=A0A183IHN5_9BILA|nr:unnamed protein product [Soboliphyme baturini]
MFPGIEEICRRHLQFYESLYAEANPKNQPFIDANVAAAFLKRSNVPNPVLGEIWNIANFECKRFLDKKGFFVALKLIALVQQGREPTVANLTADIAPPVITSKRNEFLNSMRSEKLNQITPEERLKYDEIFETLMPINGKLSGEQVKPVLFNSGLPTRTLGKIWELSDMDRDGLLDKDEMAVALHLVYRALEGDPVPDFLQPEMVPPSKRLYCRSTSVAGDPFQHSAANYSSSFKFRTDSIASLNQGDDCRSGRSAASRSLTGSPSALWNFSVDTKKWQPFFNELDKNHVGVVSGSDVKETFLQTGLPQSCLAQIWSLCDMKNSGTLDLDQFALAMYLIEEKKNFNKGPPASLPLDLIPPSCRAVNGGMSDMSTSTTEIFHAESKSSSGSSKEVEKITAEIREMQSEKRTLETQVFETQNELNTRQASIHTMEVECDTFETTVRQLEAQKAEANRRLDELEHQRATLSESLESLKARLEAEQSELRTLQAEAENRMALAKGQSAVEKLSGQRNALAVQVAKLEQLLLSDDIKSASSYQMMQSVIAEMSDMNLGEMVPSGSATDTETKPEETKVIEDPFLSSDPFVSGDSALSEPYDLFGDKDSFPKKDFGFVDAAFKQQMPNAVSSKSPPFDDDEWFSGKVDATIETSRAKKTPPPRPALPKLRTATSPSSPSATKDPFTSSPSDPFQTKNFAEQDDRFSSANFADFSQFH